MNDWSNTPVEGFLARYPVPSVEGLCFLLRNPEFWPEDFEWDYGCIGSCGLGLARDVWNLKCEKSVASLLKTVCDAISMTVHYGKQAFEYADSCLPVIDPDDFETEREKVSPELVADELQYWYGRQGREMVA